MIFEMIIGGLALSFVSLAVVLGVCDRLGLIDYTEPDEEA